MKFKVFYLFCLVFCFVNNDNGLFLIHAFSKIQMTTSPSSSSKDIYGIKGGRFSSPTWNWGSSIGTGHDCAMICRNKYDTIESRKLLLDQLYNSPSIAKKDRKPENFEEIKLILGLAWQRGRWDGSDGGIGGYSQVLEEMARAKRYEIGTMNNNNNNDECSLRLIKDMQQRYSLLQPSTEEMNEMTNLLNDTSDLDAAQRKCSALVLSAMGFVEKGL